MLTFLTKYKLAVVLAICIAVRVLALALFPNLFDFVQTGAIHGSASLDAYAVNLVETGVYGLTPNTPDALLPPGYPVVLAGVYALFGRGYWQVGLFHTLLDCLSIALLYAICARLFRGLGDEPARWIGALAGLLTAVYPYLVFQNLTVIDTPLFILQLHTVVYVCIRLRDEKRYPLAWVLIGGAALAWAAVTRPILLPLGVFAFAWLLLKLPILPAVARLAPVGVIALLPLLVWGARNQGVYGEFVPLSVTGGANFYQGNNPDVIPYLRAGYDAQWTSPPEGAITSPPNTPAADREHNALALAWLRENPGVIPELVWVKFLTHWSIDIFPRANPSAGGADAGTADVVQSGDEDDVTLEGLEAGDPVTLYDTGAFGLARAVHRYYFGALLVLAVIGVILTRRLWRDLALLYAVQLNMTLMYVIFHPSTRYRVPSDPLLFAFSAAAVVIMVGVVVRRQRIAS